MKMKTPFDYTRWQEGLFEDMSLEEISHNAAALRKQQDQKRAKTSSSVHIS
jgi:hypothetical protein